MKTLEKLKIENEAGEIGELTRKEYVDFVVKRDDVQEYVTEANGPTPPSKLVLFILKTIEAGQEMDDGVASEYGDLILAITADVNLTVENAVDKKAEAEAAKAAKDAEKKKREEEEAAKKAELATTQLAFAESATVGATQAAAEFVEELTELGSSLAEGVTVVAQGSGYGLKFASDTTKEIIGQTFGYLLQKSDNNKFIENQIQFWIGDVIVESVARGIYSTAQEAGKHIALVMSEKSGKPIQAISLDQYKRMAERTPVEYRNPKVDQTAYLAISQMKVPRKDAGEKDEAFKTRLTAFEADRETLQKKLAVGEITKRKDIIPDVDAVAIKHGMKTAPSNEPHISVSQQAVLFFHTSFALEELLGTHKPDVVQYKEGSDIITTTKEELEAIKASAYAHLTNLLYSDTKNELKAPDYIRGYVNKTVKTKVAEDAEGKPIMEDSTVKNLVYPRPFFEAPKKDSKEDAPPSEGVAAKTKVSK